MKKAKVVLIHTKNILNNICQNKWPNNQSRNNGAAFYASCEEDSFDILNKDTFVSWSKTNDIKFKKTSYNFI